MTTGATTTPTTIVNVAKPPPLVINTATGDASGGVEDFLMVVLQSHIPVGRHSVQADEPGAAGNEYRHGAS